MHESIFSYSLSRPYPYRWFAWLVFIGGTVATVLLSLINFGANGFETVQIYTTNTTMIESPNNTAWYQRRPWSLATKMVPTCSSEMISIGSTYYTDNGAFPYKVQWIQTNSTNQGDLVMSVAYKHAPITDCIILSIYATAKSHQHPIAPENVQVAINCSIKSGDDIASLQLSTQFNFDSVGRYATPTGSLPVFDLPDKLEENAPSLYWGQWLIMSWRNILSFPHFDLDLNASDPTTSILAGWTWERDYDESTPLADVSFRFELGNTSFVGFYCSVNDTSWSPPSLSAWSDASFKNEADQIITQNSTRNYDLVHEREDLAIDFDVVNASNGHNFPILLHDGMMKSIYWTILTDLGQTATNVLADPQRLMTYAVECSDYLTPTTFGTPLLTYPDPQGDRLNNEPLMVVQETTEFYNRSGTGIPNVQPAVFTLEYVCEIPKMKAVDGLIISIVVADLVFLQALWKTLNWLATMILTRRNRYANYCAGCEEAHLRGVERVEMRGTINRMEFAHEPGENEPTQRNHESSRLIEPATVNDDNDEDYDPHAQQLGDNTSKHGSSIMERPVSPE